MQEMSILLGPGIPQFLIEILPPGTTITPGDTRIIWDSTRPDEVDAARSTFDKLIAKGYTAFRAEGRDGEQGARLHQWDPKAERIIFIPRIQGGARW